MIDYNTYGYIYCIENKINSKKYIGLTTRDVMKRFEEHCKADSYIGKAIRKYGVSNFNVMQIDTAENDEELKRKEIRWIKEFKTFSDGYNLTIGGDGVSTAERVEVNLNKRQMKFCRWVEKENKKDIDVKDSSKMMISVLINVVYLYLIADLKKDKIKSASMIMKLKPVYLKEVLKLKVIDSEELLSYIK